MEALSVHQTRPYAPASLSCRRLIWSGALPALERVYWKEGGRRRRREEGEGFPPRLLDGTPASEAARDAVVDCAALFR